MEDIYYGQCEHLFTDDIRSSDCVKRYYEITPLHGDTKKIIVCNEYLKLKVRENTIKWRKDYRHYRAYEDTIEEIVNEFIPVSDSSFYNKNTFNKINPSFDYCVCQRPYITSKIKLFDAVKILRYGYENFNLYEYNRAFLERTYFHIYEVARYFDKYCKYKKQSENIRKLLTHLNYHNFDSENSQRLIELFLIFFEIQTYIESLKK